MPYVSIGNSALPRWPAYPNLDNVPCLHGPVNPVTFRGGRLPDTVTTPTTSNNNRKKERILGWTDG